jgi:hypothetical protein
MGAETAEGVRRQQGSGWEWRGRLWRSGEADCGAVARLDAAQCSEAAPCRQVSCVACCACDRDCEWIGVRARDCYEIEHSADLPRRFSLCNRPALVTNVEPPLHQAGLPGSEEREGAGWALRHVGGADFSRLDHGGVVPGVYVALVTRHVNFAT